MSTTGWIVLGVLAVLVIWAISIYNRLVALSQRVNQAFADIDVQLKQRHDLIPNLVETVKGYASHERGTLEAVVQARNAAIAAPRNDIQNFTPGACSSCGRASPTSKNVLSRKPKLAANSTAGNCWMPVLYSWTALLKKRRAAASLFSMSESSLCNCWKFVLALRSG